ncbi:sterol desaturase [Flavilitoribacter nigricans DSM 23189 = NBRC 102662]|uniref:Sterol desaturase n=2 Tax=Flavilitoribacter TaxID=2762562 RepID=A0A2D0NEC9_FLAN2|nr:sterol desaturase [Flavilitoribacter nigricans DSM 23189 = NBRC 102662]
MEAYANVLLYAIPMLFSFVILEAGYSWCKGTRVFRSLDTISSISSGVANTLKSVLGLTVFIIGYEKMETHLAIYEVQASWQTYLIAFLSLDFATYWSHRLSHEVNFFWNKHVVHHTSEEYNLAVALRQPISEFVSLFFIFMFPAALLGVPPEVVAILTPVHFLLQFWIHTPHIGKLGVLEYIIVTPSQHRVHHALNDIYIDKNLSGVFCIWDRLFGTFQEELDEEPPVYGSTRPLDTWNPIKQNFAHLLMLIRDAWYTNSWWDKLRIWFMPTGWRPEDVQSRFPVRSVDQHSLVKFDTRASPALHAWSWFQCVLTTLMLMHLLLYFKEIGFPDLFIYGAFLFLTIYAYTALMDKDKNAFWIEGLRCLFGLAIIWYTADWFALPALRWVVAAELLISLAVVGWFVRESTYVNTENTKYSTLSNSTG